MTIKTLQKYFASGDAQAERKIRKKIFFRTAQYDEIIDFSFGKLKILISPKGVGKSCLIEETHSNLLDSNFISLLITPSSLDIEEANKCSALSSKSNIFEKKIIKMLSHTFLDVTKDLSLSNREDRLLLENALSGEYNGKDLKIRLAKFVVTLFPMAKQVSDALMQFDGYSKTDSTLTQYCNLRLLENEFFYLLMMLTELQHRQDLTLMKKQNLIMPTAGPSLMRYIN